MKKRSDWTNVALSVICAVFFTLLIWRELDPRGAIFFALCLAMGEVFIHVRWRMSMPCPHCGFDPLLYKNKRDVAVAQVKKKLDHVRASGQYLLRQNNPFQNLPKQRPEEKTASLKNQLKAAKKSTTGKYLSREA